MQTVQTCTVLICLSSVICASTDLRKMLESIEEPTVPDADSQEHEDDSQEAENIVFRVRCLASKDVGHPCTQRNRTSWRRYYDPYRNRCRKFRFAGCGGNANNYGSLAACEDACVLRDDEHHRCTRKGDHNSGGGEGSDENTREPPQVTSSTEVNTPTKDPNEEGDTKGPPEVTGNPGVNTPHNEPHEGDGTQETPEVTRSPEVHTPAKEPNEDDETNEPPEATSSPEGNTPNKKPNEDDETKEPPAGTSSPEVSTPHKDPNEDDNTKAPPEVTSSPEVNTPNKEPNEDDKTKEPPQVTSSTEVSTPTRGPNEDEHLPDDNTQEPPQVTSSPDVHTPTKAPNEGDKTKEPSQGTSSPEVGTPTKQPNQGISTPKTPGGGNRTDSIRPGSRPNIGNVTKRDRHLVDSFRKFCREIPEAGGYCDLTEHVGYYYDGEYEPRECRQYRFSGCESGNNHYETLRECEDYCLKHPKRKDGLFYVLPWSTESRCLAPPDTGMRCTARQPRGRLDYYYYESRSQTCLKLRYKGCGGNRNKYRTITECEQVCSGVKYGEYPNYYSDDRTSK